MHHNRPARALFSLPSLAGLSLLCLITLFSTGGLRASEHPASAGSLLLMDGKQTHEALLLKADIQLHVQGLLASMTLTQNFKNQSDLWLEGQYQFPMPEKSTVRGLQIKVGERLIEGTIKKSAVAESQYQAAAAAGEIASIVGLDRPNLFSVRVANIAPREEISVALSIMLPVQFSQSQFRLSLPTTITPRYTNQATPDAEQIRTPVLHAAHIRGPHLNLAAKVDGISDPTSILSDSHVLSYGHSEVRLVDTAMDRDIELSWALSDGEQTRTHVYSSEYAGNRHVQLMMIPPQLVANDEPSTYRISRELILLVDKSGSMAGQSIRAARAAVQSALDGLNEDDSFNIIAFDDQHQALFSSSRSATAKNISIARGFVSQLDADGGTEMMPALQMALNGEPPERDLESNASTPLRQIVFITDGSVAYESQMLKTIEATRGKSRLFTIGIGNAPNRWFLSKAAELGRGTSLRIAEPARVQKTMERLFDILERPAVTDIEVTVDKGSVEFHPSLVPDLYSDEPLMLIGKIEGMPTKLTIKGSLAGQNFTRSLMIPAPAELDSQAASASELKAPPIMAQHWARSRIESLEDEQRRHGSNIDSEADRSEMHRQAITELALSHGLVSQYTRFVALEQERVRPATQRLDHAQVANLMPAGNLMGIAALPAGAAGADTMSAIAALFAVLGSACLWQGRRRKKVNWHGQPEAS